jgi:hypothetical protein
MYRLEKKRLWKSGTVLATTDLLLRILQEREVFYGTCSDK